MHTSATQKHIDHVKFQFEHIREHSEDIKSFVGRHGERSAMIFARALTASFKPEDEFLRYLMGAPRADEFNEACRIVRSIGREAGALLPQLVFTYYNRSLLDHYA